MATSTEATEYVCTLSDDLIKKAEEELNEKPQWRSRDIQALRDMVQKRTDLKIRTDDAFLLRFLRAKKFDYERAFNLIQKHFDMKADEKNQQLFSNLRPSAVKHVLEAGVTGVLSHRDKLGRRVIVFRPGRWDPSKYSIDDIFRTNFMTLSKLIQDESIQINGVILLIDMGEIGFNHARNISPFIAKKIASLLQEEETQVNGVVMMMDLDKVGFGHAKNISPFYAKRIMSLLQEEESQICGIVLVTDLKCLSWKHIRHVRPFYAKRIMSLLQDCFPMRFKGIHYINEPAVFDYIFAIIRPFMKEKILSRIHFHGNRFEELKEYIDVEHLPSDYGGNAPPYTNDDWKDILLACDAEFDAEAKYGLIRSTGKTDSTAKGDAIDGLAGSYRKLDI